MAPLLLCSHVLHTQFLERPAVAEKMTVTVFKVSGETNTDDLSPAPDAWSRPDIPLHGLAMLKIGRDGITPNEEGECGPMNQIDELKEKGFPLAYVGDVVGTGSSRKSATNSVLWFMGDDIPYVPNKRTGGLCIGDKVRLYYAAQNAIVTIQTRRPFVHTDI